MLFILELPELGIFFKKNLDLFLFLCLHTHT